MQTNRDIRKLLAISIISIAGACVSPNVQNTLFVTEQLPSRNALTSITHSADFVLFFDREKRVAYGMVADSYLGNLNIDKKERVDSDSISKLSSFLRFIGKASPKDVCTKNLELHEKSNVDKFAVRFDKAVSHLRRLGYPLIAATYQGDQNGYAIEISYFAECEYLENDALEFARRLASHP